MTADMAGEWAELLAGLTLEELAGEHGAGTPDWDRAVSLELGRRQAADARPRGRPNGYLTGDSAEWYEAAHAQMLQAEQECRGALLNRRGLAAGLDPMTLWTGPRSVADAYASWELAEFWASHPRVTVTAYRERARADRRIERAEWQERMRDAVERDAPGAVRPESVQGQEGTRVLPDGAGHDVSRPDAGGDTGTGWPGDRAAARGRGAAVPVLGGGPVSDPKPLAAEATRPQAAVSDSERAAQPRTAGGSYADTVPVEREWVLDGKIAAGGVTLLAGRGKIGKGLLCAAIAAAVTRGDIQIDGTPAGPAGDVIMVTPEDDAAADVIHRLMAAGAVLERVHDATELGGGPFLLPGSLAELRERLADCGQRPCPHTPAHWPATRLLIIDPLLACSTVSLAANVTVRQKIVLPLERFARAHGVAVLLIHHTTKGGVIASSKGLTDACRSVLRVDLDSQRPDVRVLTVEYTNIATADQTPLRYVIEGDWPSTRAVFAGQAGTPDAGTQPGTMPEPDTLEQIRGWLEANGPAAASRICAGTRLDYQTVRTALTVLHSGKMVTLAPGGGWQAGTAREAGAA